MINVVFPVLNEELRLEKGIQTVVPFKRTLDGKLSDYNC